MKFNNGSTWLHRPNSFDKFFFLLLRVLHKCVRYLFLLCIFYMLCIYNVVPVLFVFELFCKCQGREANVFMYSVLSEKAYYAINGFSVRE